MIISKKLQAEYEKVYNTLGDEFSILRNIPVAEIKSAGFVELGNVVDRMRNRDVHIEPGYDGVYGTIKLFKDEGERR